MSSWCYVSIVLRGVIIILCESMTVNSPSYSEAKDSALHVWTKDDRLYHMTAPARLDTDCGNVQMQNIIC